MATTMHAEVVSAEGHVLTADVRELYARGVEGEIGILPGHQPALVALDVGAVKLVDEDGGVQLVAVHRGVLFVGVDGTVIVLADIAELAGEIDRSRADAKRRELEQELGDADTDSERLRDSLRKQKLRLELVDSTGARAGDDG
jgi:F-type H+-transporting ATPase subunit epsilon